jgi:hypothetical protein
MREKDHEHGHDGHTTTDQWPGGRTLTGLDPQQHQAGDRKEQDSNGDDVDEDRPGDAGVASLVKVVEVGDPASIGGFVFRRAAGTIDGHPCVAARTRSRQVQLLVGPLRARIAQ